MLYCNYCYRDRSAISDENERLLVDDSGVESSMSNEGSPDLTHQNTTESTVTAISPHSSPAHS